MFEAQCIISLVQELKNKTLAGNLFVELLQEFTNLENESSEEEGKYSERHLMLLQVLIICSEVLGPDIVQNITQVCTMIKVLLSNQDIETLHLALGILNVLLNGNIKLEQGEEILLFELTPELENLTIHQESSIRQLAEILHNKINARDQSWLKADASVETSNSHPKDPKEKIKEILKDLNDPLLPVRAAGLVELRKLVLSKDPIAEKNLDKVLNIFKTQIFDEDS